jgi:Leucine-rich repeat (LRR) protein
LKSLIYLNLSDCRVTDNGLGELMDLSQMEFLVLRSTKITFESVLLIGQYFRALVELDLSNNGISDKSIFTCLQWLERLEKLTLSGLELQCPQAVPLVTETTAVLWPRLRSLDISKTPVLDADMMDIIARISSLRELNMNFCPGLTEAGLAIIFDST